MFDVLEVKKDTRLRCFGHDGKYILLKRILGWNQRAGGLEEDKEQIYEAESMMLVGVSEEDAENRVRQRHIIGCGES